MSPAAGLVDPREEARRYERYHARRYRRLLAAVDDLADGPRPAILDVGPNFQTGMLRERWPAGSVDTLGFAHPWFPPREGERHVELDLNRVVEPQACPQPRPHDVVVLAEVIEHLYTAAALVLRYLAGWLRPGGAMVVQTPNAVALHKRLRLLAGRNVLEPIRTSRMNPGHFHEYTAAELADAARDAGLDVERVQAENYFGAGPGARAYAAAGRVMPPGLRHGLTAVLRRPEAATA